LDITRHPEDAPFDEHGLQVHARTSPSTSPHPSSDAADAPSPSSSLVTSPPTALPPHMQDEVMVGRESASSAGVSNEGGASPSGQFAGIHIDSGSSMSGSDRGENGTAEAESRNGVASSPGRDVGRRSTSPAKRSAADMEDEQAETAHVPGSFPKVQDEGPTHFDQVMKDMTPVPQSDATQDTIPDSQATSADVPMTTDTSAPSQNSSEPSPPYSEDDKWKKGSSGNSSNRAPSLEEQQAEIMRIVNEETLDEGTRGFLIANRWLQRVTARTPEGLKDASIPKEAREGPIGHVDNSSIVPPGGLESQLKDLAGQRFVPLKPGLMRNDDFEVLPEKAWGKICEWYPPPPSGKMGPTQQIVRYVHNTAEPPQEHYQYELYPPVFTIRKVPQPGNEAQRPASAQSSVGSVGLLHLRDEQRGRGQNSPDDAVRLVSSQQEKIQNFLARAKDAAGIARSTKVRVFKLLNPENATVDRPDARPSSTVSAPVSRSASPGKASKTTDLKLVLPPAEFKQMNVGTELEQLDIKDATANDKYNGSSTVQTYGLHEDCVLILEEMIGGPGGGEFQSDSKKPAPKFSLTGKKSFGSKPASTPASGRSSPTPGGMLTRGRARKDGRTRGTVGLTNLGNTCYMNSALQCIRSVEELATYFLSGYWKKEINHDNPLGHNGAMAKQYSQLLSQIYGDNAGSSVSPTAFKRQLGSSAPLFSGYGQQDSQEFLSFLVDAIHEDLNRIIKKPYNENPDSDDNTVHDPQAIIKLGETYRANHRARNDSVAMDLFNGFYKNTMECPACEKVSVTFDPYSLLTVQLPVENAFSHKITYVPFVGNPVIHDFEMDKNSTVRMLKEYIARQHPGTKADHLWMAEVYSQKIYKVFEDKVTLMEASIQSNDFVFIFELQQAPTNLPEPEKKSYGYYSNWNTKTKEIVSMDSPKADCIAVPVFSRRKTRFNNFEMILHPLYITVTREEAQDFTAIKKKVLFAVAQQTSRPILAESSAGLTLPKESANEDMADREESASEESARVSDRSASDEDGYVNVSMAKKDGDSTAQHVNGVNGVNGDETRASDERIPSRFFEPDYVPPVFHSSLFRIGYAQSSEGLHCASMASFDDRSVKDMFSRVKRPERRPSMQSLTSDESATSPGADQANGDGDHEDAEDSAVEDEEKSDMDKPDITIGGYGDEDALHVETPTTVGGESDSELPKDGTSNQDDARTHRHGRGKANKFGKKGKRKHGKPVTHSRKNRGKRDGQQHRPGSSASQHSHSKGSASGNKNLENDDPYYIKIGEGIVLEWTNEGLDELFGATDAPADDDDVRGRWLSTKDGRGLEEVEDPVLNEKRSKRALRKKHGITLEDCFAETGKREILSEDNAWYCNRCKEMRQAAKTLEIWTIPDILIVHLKRFAGNRSFRDKIDVFVDYPIEGLDMTERIGLKDDGKEYIYDLFAVDNHYGGLGGGHYTAYAKNFYDGQWYDYNG
jgi:ubiquitin carboxyl-terminal hydrolase 4/11